MMRAVLRLIAALTVLLLGSTASGRAADLVVVESRGVALKAGQAVDGTKPLSLKDGQQVVLIAPTGQMIKLHGPWDKPPIGEGAAANPDVGDALKALLTQSLAKSEKVGVVRGGTDQVVPPDPWLVDVTHVGIRCVPANQHIVFWRPGGGAAAPLSIQPYDRSWRARTEWPAGADRLPMPPSLPLTNRATYVVDLNGKAASITIVAVPAAASNDAMRAAWMLEEGCDGQARALLQRAR